MQAAFIFGSVFAVITCYGLLRWWLVSRVVKWPRTKAKITLLDVRAVRASFNSAPYVRYDSHIEYHYEVNGVSYVSNRFSLHNGLVGNRRDELKDLIGGASQGDIVDASYNPNKPSHAILAVPGYTGVAIILIIGGCGLGLVIAVALGS